MRPAKSVSTVARVRAGRLAWCAVLGILILGAAGCGSSTTTSTAPSTTERCGVTLRSETTAVPAAGGAGTIAVATARECAWSAASEASWLAIDGPSSGQGDGSIAFRAARNPDPMSRRSAIAANGQRTEITQAAAECAIRLGDSGAAFPPAGGEGAVEIEASSSLCAWTAATDAPWITFTSPAAGTGSASVRFAVAPTTGPPRAGIIRIAGQAFSVTQSQGCTYTIAPASAAFPPAGGGGEVAVSSAAGCPWTASSNTPWITIVRGSSGSGSGTMAFAVAPTGGPARTGTLVVAGETFTVTQAPGCAYRVEPLALAAPASGGTLSVTVRTEAGCAWTAASGVPWITVAGAAAGTGDGTVVLAIAAAAGSARTGTVVVAGSTVTVSQAQGCTYEIAPASAVVPASGGAGRVQVTTAAGCPWTAASGAGWITVTAGASGSGSGAVEYRVEPTAGAARTGTIAIAGRTFTVTQGGECAATLSPASAVVGASGGSPRFDVRTAAGCEWAAASNVPWIRIRSGASGSGDGTVRLDVEANAGAARTGTVTAAGETFTVTQGSGCAVALGDGELDVPAAGGDASVAVRAPAGCAWTAEAAQPWTTIVGGASGVGDGRVSFRVEANAGSPRTGTLAIGGETLTIRQAGACVFEIEPARAALEAGGGRVTVAVGAAAGCAWTAAPNEAWISIAGGATGTGGGTVEIVVAANSGPARTGTVTIAGETFTVEQASGCASTIAPESRSEGPRGGSGSFTVTMSDPSCTWTAVSRNDWITVTRGASGAGAGRVDYIVAPNPGPPRAGTIAVEHKVFTVRQSGR